MGFFDIIKKIQKEKGADLQDYSVEISLQHPDDVLSLFASNDRHLRLIEENIGVVIHART